MSKIAMRSREWTALTMLDFGFMLPEFGDVMPGLAERGWIRSYADRWQVTGAGRRAMRGLPPEQPVQYGCDADKHATTAAAECRWPVHCGLCGEGLDRWYYGMRAPMCARCIDKSGPVLPPAAWEIAPQRCSVEGYRVWESWAAAASSGSGEER